jgi:hypothetical protein
MSCHYVVLWCHYLVLSCHYVVLLCHYVVSSCHYVVSSCHFACHHVIMSCYHVIISCYHVIMSCYHVIMSCYHVIMSLCRNSCRNLPWYVVIHVVTCRKWSLKTRHCFRGKRTSLTVKMASKSRRGEGKGEGLFNEAKRVLQSSMNYLYRHLYHLDFISLRVFNGSRIRWISVSFTTAVLLWNLTFYQIIINNS